MGRFQNDELQIQEAPLSFVDIQLFSLGMFPVVSIELFANNIFELIQLIYILFTLRLKTRYVLSFVLYYKRSYYFKLSFIPGNLLFDADFGIHSII